MSASGNHPLDPARRNVDAGEQAAALAVLEVVHDSTSPGDLPDRPEHRRALSQPQHVDAEARDGIARDGRDVAVRAERFHEEEAELVALGHPRGKLLDAHGAVAVDYRALVRPSFDLEVLVSVSAVRGLAVDREPSPSLQEVAKLGGVRELAER